MTREVLSALTSRDENRESGIEDSGFAPPGAAEGERIATASERTGLAMTGGGLGGVARLGFAFVLVSADGVKLFVVKRK